MFGVWTEIVCEKCSDHGAGQWTYGNVDRRGLAASAKGRGWKREGDGWVCPACEQRATRKTLNDTATDHR